tara:strand:+ start:1765 stop:2730 length:966 start_codon:yes stop_codon:yes gene_type:complete
MALSKTLNEGSRNVLINGNFNVWQRGTSLATAGFITDRWRSTTGLNGAMTISRQPFTLGQTDVPNNPKYFFRHAQTTAHTNTGYNHDRTRIESVETLAGKVCILTWYMKADASRTIAVRRIQNFGTGGSPSASVDTQILASQAITTSWAKYTLKFTMPSISGKTIGTANNDYVEIGFDYGAEANNTYTIDIAQVQLEANLAATPFEHRSYGEELALCQRYYETAGRGIMGGSYSATQWVGAWNFAVPKRASPTLTVPAVVTVHEPSSATYAQSSVSIVAQYPEATKFSGIGILLGNFSGMTAFRPAEVYLPDKAFVIDSEL